MQVILFMATTVNGYIAKENDEAPWSAAICDNYYKIAKQFKAIILGRRTYELMKEVNEFEKIGNPFTVVVSKEDFVHGSNVAIVASPKEALKILKKKGFAKVLAGGGGMTNSSFMKDNFIDEIILDIEPLIFGKGIKLFSDNDFEVRLKLLGLKSLSKDIVELHYLVLK